MPRGCEATQVFVPSAMFSRDGRYVLTAGADRTVRLWNVWGSKNLAVLAGHTNAVSTAIPADDWIVSGSADWTVRLWFVGDAAEPAELGRAFGKARYFDYSPDGTLMVIAGDDGYARREIVEATSTRIDARLAPHVFTDSDLRSIGTTITERVTTLVDRRSRAAKVGDVAIVTHLRQSTG
jgi:WD domain, G-beta repeat